MIALSDQWSDDERESGLIRWLVPASIALHVVVFAWLPSARRTVAAPPPLVIDVAESPAAAPPPPQEPPPKTAEPLAEPRPVKAARATPAPASAAHVAKPQREAAAAPTQPAEAPMDFTSAVFSNDGPGLAVAGGGGAVEGAASPAAAPRVAPAPPRLVPPSSLARRPRAPGLDRELERHYPREARLSGISGNAVLRVRILPDGRIGGVQFLSESWKGFGLACERTVRAARWEPPIDRDGTPVATEITYTCRFEVTS
ncbi:MAG TPA: TonB family protein [Labilithrix sp.]|nr:TonB family protein [Labilithrix sp.]